jgi:hypothetical protein
VQVAIGKPPHLAQRRHAIEAAAIQPVHRAGAHVGARGGGGADGEFGIGHLHLAHMAAHACHGGMRGQKGQPFAQEGAVQLHVAVDQAEEIAPRANASCPPRSRHRRGGPVAGCGWDSAARCPPLHRAIRCRPTPLRPPRPPCQGCQRAFDRGGDVAFLVQRLDADGDEREGACGMARSYGTRARDTSMQGLS